VVGTEDRTRDGFAQVCRMHRAVAGGAPGSGAQGAVRTFAFSRDAPAAARHFAVGALRRWGIADLADDVALVVTELAANAVRHARSGFTVVLSSRPSRPDVVRVSVRDASPLPPAGDCEPGAPLPVTPLHGLGAVNAMASHWGVESLGASGKTVWVELCG
jgi:anti-sigma regulatory factor (Ser/Thr protein kinase)